MDPQGRPRLPSHSWAWPEYTLHGVSCPFCNETVYWTDAPASFAEYQKHYPGGPVRLDPGVGVGKWGRKDVEENRRKWGRKDVEENRNVEENRIHPMKCPRCAKIYVARLGLLNQVALEVYQKKTVFAPSALLKSVEPRYGYVAVSVADFVAEVNSTTNMFTRQKVIRELRKAGWLFLGFVEDATEAEGPPQGPGRALWPPPP